MNRFMLPATLFALALTLATSAQAITTPVLRVDVNDITGPANTQPGFDSITLNDGGVGVASKTFAGGIAVNIDAVGFAFADHDRLRGTPVNGGALTEAAIYQDFIFAPTPNGLNATITGLKPNRVYSATVWSFDSGSGGARISDWSVDDGRVGTTLVADDYTFNGSVLPTADTDNRFTFTAISDAAGTLQIQGRSVSAAVGVFLNGVQLDEHFQDVVLSVDFNARSAAGGANTQAGFNAYVIDGAGVQTTVTRSFGNISITLNAGPGGSFDDRVRATPNNSGSFTQQELLRDFVFASNTAGDESLDVLIEGLRPSADYLLTLWSFDTSSGTARTSDWFANGVLVADNYSFDGTVLPTNNAMYSFSFLASSNALGQILLSGVAQAGTQPAVFLNALQISQFEPIPEPTTAGLAILSLAALARRRRRSAVA
ncbi:MAG: hypothetical protein WD768_15145 [Phycisphaeraceae bacterium]